MGKLDGLLLLVPAQELNFCAVALRQLGVVFVWLWLIGAALKFLEPCVNIVESSPEERFAQFAQFAQLLSEMVSWLA